MARINIEDDIESRQEFWRLFEVVKDRDKCLGMLVRFFRLAQKHFGKVGPITFDELEAQGLAPMVEAGWAVACGDGYQALGAEKQFAWYRDQVAASKLGGEANRKKWEALKSRPDIPLSSQPAIQPASEPSRQDSSLTLTPSLTLTNKNKTKETATILAAPQRKKKGRPETPEAQKHFGLLVGAYVTLFKAKYNGATPDTGPIPIACLKRVFAANGFERARNLLETFFQIEDAWIKKRHHDMATFEKCINQISVALTNGHEMGQINWAQVQGAAQIGGGDEVPRISNGDA